MKEQLEFFRWVGLDVSKDSFTAAHYAFGGDSMSFPKCGKFGRDAEGVRQLLAWAGSIPCGDAMPAFGIVMEETGSYSKELARLILEAAPDQHVSICNARSVACYIQSHGRQKTDRTDAALIARFGFDRRPPRHVPETEAESALKTAVRERNRLVEQRTALRNAGSGREEGVAADANRIVLDALDKAIRMLDREIRRLVGEDARAREEVGLMTSIPGVAMLSAASIYAELGSLKNYTRRQLSAMSGVCPVRIESGKSVHRSKISHAGSRVVRKILYLDTQFAAREVPAIRALRERLLARSESSRLTARCACMRKLLLTMRGIVKSGKPFDPTFTPASKKTKNVKKVAIAT